MSEKTAALVMRLGALTVTSVTIGWLQLRDAGLVGREPTLLTLLTGANATLTRLDLARNVIGGPGMVELRRTLQK